MLHIALAGAGMIGRRHAELIDASGECSLSAVIDPAPGATEFAREHNVASYKTLAELFAGERPHGVILATPNPLHADQAIQCIDAGVAVLVEKPVAHTVADGMRLCEAAERAG